MQIIENNKYIVIRIKIKNVLLYNLDNVNSFEFNFIMYSFSLICISNIISSQIIIVVINNKIE